MVDTIKLYISAAKDLQNERDLLSRIVTEIPVTLGWQINFTPFGEKTFAEKLVIDANLHILILGTDIRAPIGFELYLSRQVGRTPIFFLKRGILHTPAAADFQRSISGFANWRAFDGLADLRHQALNYIGRYFIDRADYFSIASDEYDNVSEFIKDLENTAPDQIEGVQGVAGENSVILSRERFTPKGGVMIKGPEESDQGNL